MEVVARHFEAVANSHLHIPLRRVLAAQCHPERRRRETEMPQLHAPIAGAEGAQAAAPFAGGAGAAFNIGGISSGIGARSAAISSGTINPAACPGGNPRANPNKHALAQIPQHRQRQPCGESNAEARPRVERAPIKEGKHRPQRERRQRGRRQFRQPPGRGIPPPTRRGGDAHERQQHRHQGQEHRIEIGRPHGVFAEFQGIREQGEQGAEQHRERRHEEHHIIQQQQTLPRCQPEIGAAASRL